MMMDTQPVGDNLPQKRPLEDQSNGREKKRFNNDSRAPLLKLLVPNYAAGALIGKGGSVLAELESKFNCTIRLSPNREYYPGTDERIVVLTGEKEQLVEFNNVIMEKVQSEESPRGESKPRDPTRMQQAKIVLTNGAAGLLIGRGGLTIKTIQEESKAKISIAGRADALVQGERVLTMLGSMEQRVAACRQIIEKISDEPSNVSNITLTYPSSGTNITSASTLGSMNANRQDDLYFSSMRGIGGLTKQKSKLRTTVQVEMEVPNILVGSILGKQGQTISEFIQFSGAKIQFSDKNDFAPGTTDRLLTISGDMNQTQTAYFLITQKVDQVQKELNVR